MTKKKVTKKKAVAKKSAAKKVAKKATKKKVTAKKPENKTSRTRKQRAEIYAQARVAGKNISDAFRESHPHCKSWKPEAIHSKASEFEKSGEVQVRMVELSSRHRERHNATVDRVLQEISRIAFFNPKSLFDDDGNIIPIYQLPDDVAAVISGFDFEKISPAKGEQISQGEYMRRLKLVAKEKGLDMLGKWFDMWSKQHVPTTPPGEPGVNMNFNFDAATTSPKQAMEFYRKVKNASVSA